MNQSFNLENFIGIYYNENRKGHYVEGQFPLFNDIKEISNNIVELNKEFRVKTTEFKKKHISKESYDSFKAMQNSQKEHLIEEKHKALEIALNIIEYKISNNDFSLDLDDSLPPIGGKTIYTINRSVPEPFFVLKQLQKNIQHSFKVKQADRFEILSQVKNLLDNSFPKYVIRTDIKSFFESIPHDKLKEKIEKNHILSPFSKKIIYQILREYTHKTGIKKGIPRGIGISAYLSELYMRDIDNTIKSLENVTYYARYVDDIVLVITPNTKHDEIKHLDKVKEIVSRFDLALNEAKTKAFDLTKVEIERSFDFLGCKITFNNFKNDTNIKIDITHKKRQLYMKKIKLAFDDYNFSSKFNEKESRQLLIKRLKYLAGNTRLLNVKKNILTGIYFSNVLLTEQNSLEHLDLYLLKKIDKSIIPYYKLTHVSINRIKTNLQRFSFEEGFKDRLFYEFSKKDFLEILQIWKLV